MSKTRERWKLYTYNTGPRRLRKTLCQTSHNMYTVDVYVGSVEIMSSDLAWDAWPENPQVFWHGITYQMANFLKQLYGQLLVQIYSD